MSTKPLAILAILTALLPAALADETAPIDAIVASPAHPSARSWNATLAELERDHPAVARAILQPHAVIRVGDAEQASTQAFFDRLAASSADAVLVEGAAYSVGITLPAGQGPAIAKEAPGLAFGALAALGLALATRRRMA